MLSFFLWKRTELGFVSEWKVFRTLRKGVGHFVPWRIRVRLTDSMSCGSRAFRMRAVRGFLGLLHDTDSLVGKNVLNCKYWLVQLLTLRATFWDMLCLSIRKLVVYSFPLVV